MPQNWTLNGVIYNLPTQDDLAPWGTSLTTLIAAIPPAVLQKNGGVFTLTADVDFGASFGPIASYYKSRSSNIAVAGAIRLANGDNINWRNNANNSDLTFGVGSNDRLTFSGNLAAQNIFLAGNLTFSSSASGTIWTDSGSNTVTFKAPTTISSSYTCKWPTAQGANNQYLTNDGSGNLSWTNAAGTGTVNSGTQYQLAYYATTTNAVSGQTNISTNAAGQLLITDGTVSVPGFAFFSGTSDGIFKVAANVLGFTTNGAERLRITTAVIQAAKPVVLADGSLANCALAFTAEPNTGFYRNGAATLFCAVNGANQWISNGVQVAFNQDTIPNADNAFNLGLGGSRWKDLRSVTATFSGAVTCSSTLAVTSTLTASGVVNIPNTDLQIGGNQSYPIVQVVSATSTTAFTTTSSTFQTTNLSATITPKFNTSKILIQISGVLQIPPSSATYAAASIFRGVTNLGDPTYGFSFVNFLSNPATADQFPSSMIYYDSPATTAATTYSVKLKNGDNASTVGFGANSVVQSIVLIEVAQ